MVWFSAVLMFLACFGFPDVDAWGSSNKVKLSDIQTLTLHHGRMTTGQRSRPVPQTQCVGGNAGCASFVPQVVQCMNMGSDGIDIQWECKTDMDNAYRFGKMDVICEGYDYPDDPYVLKGSCGLEYTLDLTAEGIRTKGTHNYYASGDSYFGGENTFHAHKPSSFKGNGMGNGITLIVVMLIIYALYRTCLHNTQRSPTGDDYYPPDSQYGPGSGFAGARPTPPPPPGFRPSHASDAGCGATNMGSGGPRGAGGFWGGAMTGGLLGYMFGSRNTGYQQPLYESQNRNRSFGGFGTSGSSFGASSGTRTASAFGGTRRR